jgi:hypothetical protein
LWLNKSYWIELMVSGTVCITALPSQIKRTGDMDLQNVLGDLKRERARLDEAIQALEGLGSGRKRGPGRPAGSGKAKAASGGRRHMSASARKRISEMMKKRWAERKKSAKASKSA